MAGRKNRNKLTRDEILARGDGVYDNVKSYTGSSSGREKRRLSRDPSDGIRPDSIRLRLPPVTVLSEIEWRNETCSDGGRWARLRASPTCFLRQDASM